MAKKTEAAAPAAFIWGTGRRKNAIARVRICEGEGKFLINNREVKDYLPRYYWSSQAIAALAAAGVEGKIDVFVNAHGGGLTGQAGAIRLGTITTSGAMVLPELIAEFHRRYPQVTFQLWEGEGARILELLDNRVIEIGITRTQVDQNVYESIVLPNEPLVMVMHRTRCCCGAQEDVVRLAELKDQPMIVPLRWKTIFVTQCRKLGFEPNIICVSDSIVQDVLCTKMGVGMALLPVSARSLLTDGDIIYKKLIEPVSSGKKIGKIDGALFATSNFYLFLEELAHKS